MQAMCQVTRLLAAIGQGDPNAGSRLLPIVYEDLRRLARMHMANERAGHTLQATALAHEAYLRLAGGDQQWDSRSHFFAAAAEAMRRILVENARRKGRLRHGGTHQRVEMDDALAAIEPPDDDVLAVHEGLDELAQADAAAASVVKLHYFLGLSMDETADALGMSPRTAYRCWAFARAWLYRRLKQ